MDTQPEEEEQIAEPGFGGTEDKCVGWGGKCRLWSLGSTDPNPADYAGRPGQAAPAGGRRAGSAGAGHKVFRNTAGGPAKFSAGLTRKCR